MSAHTTINKEKSGEKSEPYETRAWQIPSYNKDGCKGDYADLKKNDRGTAYAKEAKEYRCGPDRRENEGQFSQW
jgi:hypothetical protein